jgi:hypothetical protein
MEAVEGRGQRTGGGRSVKCKNIQSSLLVFEKIEAKPGGLLLSVSAGVEEEERRVRSHSLSK